LVQDFANLVVSERETVVAAGRWTRSTGVRADKLRCARFVEHVEQCASLAEDTTASSRNGKFLPRAAAVRSASTAVSLCGERDVAKHANAACAFRSD